MKKDLFKVTGKFQNKTFLKNVLKYRLLYMKADLLNTKKNSESCFPFSDIKQKRKFS